MSIEKKWVCIDVGSARKEKEKRRKKKSTCFKEARMMFWMFLLDLEYSTFLCFKRVL